MDITFPLPKQSKADLEAEGITKDLLDKVVVEYIKNVQLLPNSEPNILLKNSKDFWVMVDGKSLKDKKGKFITVSEKDAKIGYVRYNLNHKDEIREVLIEREIVRLKEMTDVQLDRVIDTFKDVLRYTDYQIENDSFAKVVIKRVLEREQENNIDVFNRKSARAKEIATEEFIAYYESLLSQKELLDDKNYNSLYRDLVEQNGLIAQLNYGQIDSIKKYFDPSNIESTMDSLEKDYLRTIASINVDIKLHPLK